MPTTKKRVGTVTSGKKRINWQVESVRLVLSMPIMQGLSKAAQQRVADALEVFELPQGTSFLVEGSPPDDVYFVCDGEVALTAEQEMVTISKAPTIIGLLSLLAGAVRSASAAAFTDCIVARMSREDFQALINRSNRFLHNIVEHLGREVRSLHAASERRRAQFDDVFTSPNARLAPGPYHMVGCNVYTFVMSGPINVLNRLLAEGLRLMPGTQGRYMLIFGFYPHVMSSHEGSCSTPFSYAESAIAIPVVDDSGQSFLYCPEQYPDNYMAIAMGRELYGFPRRYGRTVLEPQHIDLDIDRVMVARAGWKHIESVPAAEFQRAWEVAMTTEDGLSPAVREATMTLAAICNGEQPPGSVSLPLMVLNQVPSTLLTAGTEFRINELVHVPFIVDQLSELSVLEQPHVRHFTTRWLATGKCVAGFKFRADLTIGLPQRERKLQTIGDVSLGRRLWTDVKQWLP